MSVVTKAMIERYAVLHRLDISASNSLGKSNEEGIRAVLESQEKGVDVLDARLCDSPETREIFAPLRAAYFAAKNMPEPAYSNVSFFDVLPAPQTVDGEPVKSEPAVPQV